MRGGTDNNKLKINEVIREERKRRGVGRQQTSSGLIGRNDERLDGIEQVADSRSVRGASVAMNV